MGGSKAALALDAFAAPPDHSDNEACCIRTATFKSSYAPLAFQGVTWGTPDWGIKFAERTNVERGFSTLKNPDVIGLAKGLYHMRGLPNFSVLSTCMWIAHNLYLRMNEQDKLALNERRMVRAMRRHRRHNQVPLLMEPAEGMETGPGGGGCGGGCKPGHAGHGIGPSGGPASKHHDSSGGSPVGSGYRGGAAGDMRASRHWLRLGRVPRERALQLLHRGR